MSSLPAVDTATAMNQANVYKLNKMAASTKGQVDMEQIETAAKEFEAVFITEMMKPMFEGIETDGTFGGGKGEEVFRGVLIDEYGKMLSKTGQLGIADKIKAEMIRMQAERTTNAQQGVNS